MLGCHCVNRYSPGKAPSNYSQMLSLTMHSRKHIFAQITLLYFPQTDISNFHLISGA